MRLKKKEINRRKAMVLLTSTKQVSTPLLLLLCLHMCTLLSPSRQSKSEHKLLLVFISNKLPLKTRLFVIKCCLNISLMSIYRAKQLDVDVCVL